MREQTYGLCLRAKFRLSRFILSPSGGKKKQVLPFYWVTVCKTVHPVLSVHSLSVLSVCP